MCNGDVPLKIEVAAAWGQRTTLQSLGLQNNPLPASACHASGGPLPGPSLPQSIQFPLPYTLPVLVPVTESLDTPAVPQYSLRNLQNVAEVWREWSQGIAGDPAIRDLEAQYQHRWRESSSKARTLFCRRKKIWDAVITRVNRGMTEEEAVQDLEAVRGTRSLYALWLELSGAELISASTSTSTSTLISRKRKRVENG